MPPVSGAPAASAAPISLPFWLAPETQLNRLGPRVGIAWMAGFLECVTAAATAALGDLDRLQAVADKGHIPYGANSPLQSCPPLSKRCLRAPVMTAAGLAKSLRISPQAALGLLRQMQEAGLIHEATGRASWRAFTIT